MAMTNPKVINVVLGRFQLVHEGHRALITKASENNSQFYILIGSADKSRNVCNPFTFKEREHMIKRQKYNYQQEILPLPDYQTDIEWIKRIKYYIQNIKNMNNSQINLINCKTDNKIASYIINLITCKKDDKTASYIDLIKDAKIFDNVIEIDPCLENGKVISAKDKRREFFTNIQYNNLLSMDDYLEMQKKYIEAGLITEDDVYYANYQDEAKQYPRIEHTADTIVWHGKKVLLIKRGRTPGKGLYALPGGFVNQNETLQECALRELKEETGLVVDDNMCLHLVGNFDNPNRSRRGRVITTVYSVILPSDYDIDAVKAGDDAGSVEWIDADDVLKMDKSAFFEDHYDILIQSIVAIC